MKLFIEIPGKAPIPNYKPLYIRLVAESENHEVFLKYDADIFNLQRKDIQKYSLMFYTLCKEATGWVQIEVGIFRDKRVVEMSMGVAKSDAKNYIDNNFTKTQQL